MYTSILITVIVLTGAAQGFGELDIKIPPGYKLKPGLKMPPGFRPPPGFEVPMEYLVPIEVTTPAPQFSSFDYDVIIQPDPVSVRLGKKLEVSVTVNKTVNEKDKLYAKLNFTDCYWPTVDPADHYLTLTAKPDTEPITLTTDYYLSANMTVNAVRIGHCQMQFYQCDLPKVSLNEHLCLYYENWVKIGNETLVKVLREDKGELITAVYKVSAFVTIVITYFCMGCLIKGKNALEDIKRPLGPLLGFVAQFIFMPVAGFSLGKLMRINPSYRVGLFVVGLVPSAWSTKAWVLLLDGDITFSIMITTLNTVASFGMIPFWIHVLTDMTTEEHQYFESLTIPWPYLAYMLLVIIGPTAIGFSVQRLTKGKVTRCIVLPFKIVLGILLAYNIGLTVWYFHDVVFMIDWRITIASAVFVASGFLCGVLVGILARRSNSETAVIAIEAGISNVYLARLILNESLDEPENDVSSIVGIPVYLLSNVMLLIYFIFNGIRTTRREQDKRRSPVHIIRSTSYIDEPELAIQLVEMNGSSGQNPTQSTS